MKNKGESYQHTLMKNVVANKLKEEGLEVKLEEKTLGNCSVDVVGVSENRKVIVECETLLYPAGEKLKTSFSKALLRFGQIEPILCIPKFANFSEIFTVDDSGELIKYRKVDSNGD